MWLVFFSAESYWESHAFLYHWSKVIEFCSVVGTLNLVSGWHPDYLGIGLQLIVLSLSTTSFAGQRLSIVITDASVWQSL